MKTQQETAQLPATRSRLADALGALEEDEFLIVGSKHHQHYVQFACHGHHGMWMEAVSNAYIAHPDERLSDAQNEHLATLGWDDPGSADRNWSLDVAAPVPAAPGPRAALTAGRTDSGHGDVSATTGRPYAGPSTSVNSAGRSRVTGIASSGGAHTSRSSRISGRTSSRRHRSTSRASRSTIQYSATPARW